MLTKWTITFCTVGVIIFNLLDNYLPLNGLTTGEISNQYSTYFVPAGYVFAIWGVIYLLLLVFNYWVWVASPKQKLSPWVVGWYAVASLANILWLVTWHYRYLLWTLPIMIVLLVSLAVLYRLMGRSTKGSSLAITAKHVTFSVYLAWISVALISNVAVVLEANGWQGGPLAPTTWAAIMIWAAAALGTYFVRFERNIAYGLVIMWALVGIAVKFPEQTIIVWSVVGGVLVMLVAWWQLGNAVTGRK